MLRKGKPYRDLVKPLLVTGLVCLVVYTVGFLSIASYSANQRVDVLKAEEHAKVRLTKWLLTQGFDYAASDLQALARLPDTLAYNRTRSRADKQQLEQIFSVQLAQKPAYSQLRFIGEDGAEKIRLDYLFGRTLIAPDSQLQSKSSRYYVEGMHSLSVGEVYVSPLDLNVENGKIDIPYLPTVRFGVPVFDPDSKQRGMVVLNVGGKLLLDTFRLSMSNTYDAFLLNSDGHILHGPDENQEWGFMFGLPPAFKNRFPEAWQTITQSDSGSVETPAGLFLFETVYPLERIGALPAVNAGDATAKSYYWKTVTFVPNGALPGANLLRQPRLLGSYSVGLVVLLALALYLRFTRLKRQQLRRENAHQARRFRDMSSVLGEGLIVMDRAGIVTYVNPEAERILGWRSDELEARKGHQVFHVHNESEEGCPVLNVMNTGSMYRSKADIFRRKDGKEIPVSLNAAPFQDETGNEAVVISFQDFSEVQTYQDRIHQLAYQDMLTGLPNRRVLDDRLQLAVDQSERHGRFVALMFLDLDHFKEVNDTFGHDAGDLLLKEVGARIRRCIRKSDTVIRLGGDEFIVLLPEVAAPDNAQAVAEKIIQVVGKPVTLPEGEACVGVSIGIALMQSPGVTSEDLMQQADSAMYEAKRRGKNRCYLWSG